jgi:hypothetical protein
MDLLVPSVEDFEVDDVDVEEFESDDLELLELDPPWLDLRSCHARWSSSLCVTYIPFPLLCCLEHQCQQVPSLSTESPKDLVKRHSGIL